MKNLRSNIIIACLMAGLVTWGCSSSKNMTNNSKGPQDSPQEMTKEEHKVPSKKDRPIANGIMSEIPSAYFNAVDNNTRTMSGKPGTNYWTQQATYNIDAQLVPKDQLLKASGTITYQNNSPDTLNSLRLELAQNLHKKGAVRLRSQKVTGGFNLHNIKVDGNELSEITSRRAPSGYSVNGTQLYLRPSQKVLPGESVKISLDWDFKIPQQGAGGRMGYNKDNLFYLGYWYPQMSVYDDVNGWFTDTFSGNAEFYHDFADYDVNITVPEQWMVASTGKLQNGSNILKDDIYNRLKKGHQSDKVVQVVTKDDFGDVTKSPENGKVTWTFNADKVQDFAFSATKESMWDATRAEVGDRDGDGQTDYSSIDAVYRSSAPLWESGAKFTRQSIEFLSSFTDMPYPWPHMTSVEGGGIIGGGMEYPMITLIGAYKNRSKQSLFAVIAHELSHMWVPMQVSSNERRYGWMDEGTTTFNENQAKNTYYPDAKDFHAKDRKSYLRIANTDLEGPIIRWSDHQYNAAAYSVASYPKPATMLVSLRNLLGKETFNKAYHTYLKRWRYKHPYPWDLFNTFEDVTGRDLDWFWRTWYYETWTLDQAVGKVSVNNEADSTQIVIEDHGLAPMPATVKITLADGNTLSRTVPVDTWLEGNTKTIISVDGKVEKVMIDPGHDYPDVNRENNSWSK